MPLRVLNVESNCRFFVKSQNRFLRSLTPNNFLGRWFPTDFFMVPIELHYDYQEPEELGREVPTECATPPQSCPKTHVF